MRIQLRRLLTNSTCFVAILIAGIPLFVPSAATQGQNVEDAYNAIKNRAVAEKAKGDLKGAIADFGKAINLRPDDAEADNNRGIAEYAKNDWKAAIADFNKAIELKPDFAAAYNNRAAARYAKGDTFGSRVDEAKAEDLKQGPTVRSATNPAILEKPDILLATCRTSQPVFAHREAYRAYSGCALPRNQVAILNLKGTRATYVDGVAAYNVPPQEKEKNEYYVGSSDSLELLPGRHTIRFVLWEIENGKTPDAHLSQGRYVENNIDAEAGKTYTALWRTQRTGHVNTGPDHVVFKDENQSWVEITEFQNDPAAYLQLYDARLKNGDSTLALSALENYLALFPKDSNHKSVEGMARKLRESLDKAQLDAYRSANSGSQGPAVKRAQTAVSKIRGCRSGESEQPRERIAAPLTSKAGASSRQVLSNLEQVLSRATRYVQEYEAQLGNLIGQEVYIQDEVPANPAKLVTMAPGHIAKHQRTESDFAILRVGQDWTALRDVTCLDGMEVRSKSRDLEKILDDSPTGAAETVESILRENAHYNIGMIYRNTNLPTFALKALRPENVRRFAFKEAGETIIGGIRTLAVGYRELESPSLIRGLYDHDEFAQGTFWIEPETGRVLRTEMNVAGREDEVSFSWQVVVSYKYNPKLAMLLPVGMEEHYDRNGARTLNCRADYFNFRRFQVDTHFDFGPQVPPDDDLSVPVPAVPIPSAPARSVNQPPSILQSLQDRVLGSNNFMP